MKHNSTNPVETFVNNEVLIKLSNKAAALEMAIKDGSYKQPDSSDDEAESALRSPYREIYVTTSIESTKVTFLVKRQDGVKYDFFSDIKTFIAKELQISRSDLAVEDYDITESRARESESLNAIYEPLLKTRIPLSEFDCQNSEQFNTELKRRYETSLSAAKQKTPPGSHGASVDGNSPGNSFSGTPRETISPDDLRKLDPRGQDPKAIEVYRDRAAATIEREVEEKTTLQGRVVYLEGENAELRHQLALLQSQQSSAPKSPTAAQVAPKGLTRTQ